MQHVIKLFLILTLTVMAFSCVKEGHVCYCFEVGNGTDTPMTINMSSWGNYNISINGIYDSKYKFHKTETIEPYSSLIFSVEIGDDPDPCNIPSSLVPAWEYITAIECNGVSIPKDYFTNIKNWDIGVAPQINGTFTFIHLYILPELIEQFGNDSQDVR